MDAVVPTLSVGRKVRIANPRLNRLFYSIVLGLVGIKISIILSDPGSYTISIASKVRPRVFGSWDRIKNTSQRPFATHPQLCPNEQPTVVKTFSYPSKYGLPPVQYNYTGHCKLVCGTKATFKSGGTDSCAAYLDLLPRSSNEQVQSSRIAFIAEAPFSKGSRNPGYIEEVWIPEAAEFRLHIHYGFKLLESLPFLAGSFKLWGPFYFPWPAGSRHYIEQGSEATMKTVILDQRGKEFKIFDAGESIALALSEVLSVATGPRLVDREVHTMSPRYHLNLSKNPYGIEGTLPQWVYHYGAGIEADIGCYMNRFDMTKDGWLNRESSLNASPSLPICLVRFRLVPSLSVADSTVLAYDVSVSAETAVSSIRFFSLTRALSMVIETVIFLGMAKTIMKFFMVSCLGDLSRMYRKALETPFDERAQIASLALRLVGSSHAFQELVDVRDHNHEISLMSLQSMYNQLRIVFGQSTELQCEEIDRIARFCCQEVKTLHSKLEIVLGQADKHATRERRPNADGATISIEDYNRAWSHNDALELHQAIGIFDSQKKRHFLERLFTPSALKNSLRSETDAQLSDHVYEAYGLDLHRRSLSCQLEEVKQAHVAGGVLEEVIVEVRSLKAETQAAREENIALKAEIQAERELRCSLEARLERLAIEITAGCTIIQNQVQHPPDKNFTPDGVVKELYAKHRRELDTALEGLRQHEPISKQRANMQPLSCIPVECLHACLEELEPRLKSVEERLDSLEASCLYQTETVTADLKDKLKDRLGNLEQGRLSSLASEAEFRTIELRSQGLQKTPYMTDRHMASIGHPLSHDARWKHAGGVGLRQIQAHNLGSMLPLGSLLPRPPG